MKIAMIGQKGMPALFGGIERHVEELSIRLVQRGHDVTVFTRPYFTPAHKKTYRGVHLISLPSIRTKHFDAISHTFRSSWHAARGNFNVIHYHGVGPSLLSFLPKLFGSKAKVISTFHCIDRKHQKWGLIARLALRLGEWASLTFPDETIAVSKTIQRYGRLEYKRMSTYIPNGVPIAAPKSLTARATLKRFDLEPDEYILSVSRLIPHKGIHYLIAAYRRIKTAKKLVIVGDGFYTDHYVDELHELAKGDPRIIFTGFQRGKALHDIYSHASLFVLPSESEGLPIALLEAASYGRCILASNIPENMEVIHGQYPPIGYTFRNTDVDDLERQLRMILRQPKTMKAVGHRAMAIIQQRYNWEAIVTGIEKLYAQEERATLPRSTWYHVPVQA